jgi:hypothetical protein
MDENSRLPSLKTGRKRRKRSAKRAVVFLGEFLPRRGKPCKKASSKTRSQGAELRSELEWEQVLATSHAIDRYRRRAGYPTASIEAAVYHIRHCITTGRRSDRDYRLVRELAPWLQFVQWRHTRRNITLFFDEPARLCVLAVPDAEDPRRIVALTCFFAASGHEGQINS